MNIKKPYIHGTNSNRTMKESRSLGNSIFGRFVENVNTYVVFENASRGSFVPKLFLHLSGGKLREM